MSYLSTIVSCKIQEDTTCQRKIKRLVVPRLDLYLCPHRRTESVGSFYRNFYLNRLFGIKVYVLYSFLLNV